MLKTRYKWAILKQGQKPREAVMIEAVLKMVKKKTHRGKAPNKEDYINVSGNGSVMRTARSKSLIYIYHKIYKYNDIRWASFHKITLSYK